MNLSRDSIDIQQRRIFWRPLIRQVLESEITPFYLFSSAPLAEGWAELQNLSCRLSVPARHWYSCKTQPLPQAMQAWKSWGGGAEVVSELELRLARATGFETEHTLVNGPLKHRWLGPLAEEGQRVHFDSLREIEALGAQAKRQSWRVGVRLLLGPEYDPEQPDWPTQFGMGLDEARRAARLLRRHGLELGGIHFHLRTSIANPEAYRDALRSGAALCDELGWRPVYVDLGGGFPPPFVNTREGRRFDRKFNFRSWSSMVNQELRAFPQVQELWMEHGRFPSARSGVLVVTIRDGKQRRGMRHLLCDGGKTLHALVANWERHDLWSLPRRTGRTLPTIVSGPTCMAFDKLGQESLPATLRPGDVLVWMDAGAYHLPWETRFSHGLAPVWWHDETGLRRVRRRESFADWMDRWI